LSLAAHWPILALELAVLTHGTSISLAEMWGRHLGETYRNGRANFFGVPKYVFMRFIKFMAVQRAS
jgi:hypothetical protein